MCIGRILDSRSFVLVLVRCGSMKVTEGALWDDCLLLIIHQQLDFYLFSTVVQSPAGKIIMRYYL